MKPYLKIGILLVTFFVTATCICGCSAQPGRPKSKAPTPKRPQARRAPAPSKRTARMVVAENLQVPWAIAFLPNGDLLVTERPGRLRLIGKRPSAVIAVQKVRQVEESGLLGLALHPGFAKNRLLYLYMTITNSNGNMENRVYRYRFENSKLSGQKAIVTGISAGSIHDGGRIAFGPDGLLYITTGDAGERDRAQDKSSLAGKILRVSDDGSIPPDNPFGNAVYSFGHRNPQGLAWDNKGRLWATEHGQSGCDELNLIIGGDNYGWPVIECGQTGKGMISPVANSGSDTWAPAGLAFWKGRLFFGGLRSESLFEAVILDGKVSLKRHFQGVYGRIRAVSLGPDGYLYFSTSNRDGRGNPGSGDDRVIMVDPESIK